MEKRVVITGMGAVTPVGLSVPESWAALVRGESGISRITLFDPSDLPTQIAGEVTDFDPTHYVNRKEARRMSRASHLAIAALREAQADAGLPEYATDPERTGVMMGTAIGGFDISSDAIRIYEKRGWTKVSPFAVPATLPNMVSHHVSLYAQTQGAIGTQVAACSAGVQAIGEGAELIRRGSADLVFAGGADATVTNGIMAGFCAMRAMPTSYNDAPERASRPFDAAREGFVLAEGAGIVVLERLDHALARGAKIYGEYLGYASASDAHHMAVPHPESAGAIRAMKWAMQAHSAFANVTKIDYINAHGTSTPLNDIGETEAVKAVFGDLAYATPISSTKSLTGHTMGAAGAIESIFCLKALETGILPPTCNYENRDPECDLDYVVNAPRETNPRIVMCNAFGLGGQNAAIIFGRYRQSS
jgi:beta-ketoacyl-acyl-carrier-protein synthase II